MVIAGEDIDMVIYALSVLKMMLNEGHVLMEVQSGN
jgi:hypothetical protein